MRRNLVIAAIVLGLVFLLLLLVLVGVIPGRKTSISQREVTLTIWTALGDKSALAALIADYQALRPKTKFAVQEISEESFEAALVDALASGRGPDIWTAHHTWLAKHQAKMSVAPQSLLSAEDFRAMVVDVAADEWVLQNRVWGVPLFVDTLQLYYNRDLLNSAGIPTPPKTWEEFLTAVPKLTKKDGLGNILVAGAALGGASNVANAADILSALMLQTGTKMVDLTQGRAAFDQPVTIADGSSYNAGEGALRFYTDFANPSRAVYTWQIGLPSSRLMFADGKAAMLLDYASGRTVLKTRSPQLPYRLAPLPQPAGATVSLTYPNYWAYTVSARSANKSDAWEFLAWLAEASQAEKYANLADTPPARRDLIARFETDPELGVFTRGALQAKSWYQVDNSKINEIFSAMIEDVAVGRSRSEEAISAGAQEVSALMQQKR